jgi:hypothetical protein
MLPDFRSLKKLDSSTALAVGAHNMLATKKVLIPIGNLLNLIAAPFSTFHVAKFLNQCQLNLHALRVDLFNLS